MGAEFSAIRQVLPNFVARNITEIMKPDMILAIGRAERFSPI